MQTVELFKIETKSEELIEIEQTVEQLKMEETLEIKEPSEDIKEPDALIEIEQTIVPLDIEKTVEALDTEQPVEIKQPEEPVETNETTQVETKEPITQVEDTKYHFDSEETTQVETEKLTLVLTDETTRFETEETTQILTEETTRIETEETTQVVTEETTQVETEASTQDETGETSQVVTEERTNVETEEETKSVEVETKETIKQCEREETTTRVETEETIIYVDTEETTTPVIETEDTAQIKTGTSLTQHKHNELEKGIDNTEQVQIEAMLIDVPEHKEILRNIPYFVQDFEEEKLAKFNSVSGNMVDTQVLPEEENDIHKRPVSPHSMNIKNPKFLIRKTYFERISSPQNLDQTMKNDHEINESQRSNRVKDEEKTSTCKKRKNDTDESNNIKTSSSVKKSGETLLKSSRKSLEHIEPMESKRNIFEKNIASDNANFKFKTVDTIDENVMTGNNMHIKKTDSRETDFFKDIVKQNKTIFEKPMNFSSSEKSTDQAYKTKDLIRSPEPTVNPSVCTESKSKHNKTISKDNDTVQCIGTIGKASNLIEHFVQDNNTICENNDCHNSEPRIQPLASKRSIFETKTVESTKQTIVEKYDPIVKDRKNTFENSILKIDNNENRLLIPFKSLVEDKRTTFEQDQKDVDTEKVLKGKQYKRHESLEAIVPTVSAVKQIFEELPKTIDCDIKQDYKSNIEFNIKKQQKIKTDIEEVYSKEDENESLETSNHSVVTEITPMEEMTKTAFEQTTSQFAEKIGSINEKKILFEQNNSIQLGMKIRHDSLDYIDPIVTTIKNVFETKGKVFDSVAECSPKHVNARGSNASDYLPNENHENNVTSEQSFPSPARLNLCERNRNRLAETYANSKRASEAVESKVNSNETERYCDVQSEGNSNPMQTNDEDCINSKFICSTQTLQGDTFRFLHTGSPSQIRKIDRDGKEKEDSILQAESSGSLDCEGKMISGGGVVKVGSETQNIFLDVQEFTQETTFLTWASNEEFCVPEAQNREIDFKFHSEDSEMIGQVACLGPLIILPDDIVSYHAEENHLIYDENNAGKIKFLLETPKPDKDIITQGESNQSSLDYDSIIQAPSLDEALEKLDIKLKKEVVKDFKNDPEKLDLFNNNKCINIVTNKEKKLKLYFEQHEDEKLILENSQFNVIDESLALGRLSPIPRYINTSPPESLNPFLYSPLLGPESSDILYDSNQLPLSENDSPEFIENLDFDPVELKKPDDILLMGPAEKEIVWGITDEEECQILQNSAGMSDEKRRSPDSGKLHYHQPRRSPSPLAMFLNSSLGTIDETQEDLNSSIDKPEVAPRVQLTHTHSLSYGSESETSVSKEELDLNKIMKSNPSIHISNYDIECFIENENKNINNEKIIEVILEETLLATKSPALTDNREELEVPAEQILTTTPEPGCIENSNQSEEVKKIEQPSEKDLCGFKAQDYVCKVLSSNIKSDDNGENTMELEDKDTKSNLDKKEESFDFECKPEFVQKWKAYWDERFSQNKEIQRSMNHSVETQQNMKKRRSPSDIEYNENFVTKQKRIFENERISQTISSEVHFNNGQEKQLKDETKKLDTKSAIDPALSISDTSKIQELVVKQNLSNLRENNLCEMDSSRRSPSIRIKDIVKKQTRKFESLLRRSFKAKKIKISNKENLKDVTKWAFSDPQIPSPVNIKSFISEISFSDTEKSPKKHTEKNSHVFPLQIETEDDEEDNLSDKSLSATYKIMRDVNMIPHSQTYAEWKQLYCDSLAKNYSTRIKPDLSRQHHIGSNMEQKTDVIEIENENFVQETDSLEDGTVYIEDSFQKDKEEIVQEWKKDLYKKLAKPILEKAKKEDMADQHTNDAVKELSEKITIANIIKTMDHEESPESNDQAVNTKPSESSSSKEKEIEDTSFNIEEHEHTSEPIEDEDQTISGGSKYSKDYPYLPKTPVEDYQHRSDLYKELITRKQLFKLTQFVKK
uniref:Uncharacterized protein n=1 Tax=Cacopsylla melanoneura TaxID=428564 RepID=A0A8D8WGX4_9HEMI